MNTEQVINLCKEKEQELLNKYFGNLVKEAAVERPETIGVYTKDLPLKIEAEYSTNAFYYGYLGMVSLLPQGARKTHHEIGKKWRNFPNGTALDLAQEEYERFQMYEINKMQEEYDRFGAEVNFEDHTLSDMEERLEKLEMEEQYSDR